MKLPKRDKTDKPKPVKPAKAPNTPGAKPDRPAYFWEPFLEKRRKAKMPRRESSIPAKPTSKEDKVKLMIAGAIVLLVPVIWIILNTVNTARIKAAEDAVNLQNKR